MVSRTRRNRILHFLACCVLTLCAAGSAFAQLASSITGVVTDSTGASVPGAVITVKNTATQAGRTVKTDGAGRYTVSSLGNGTYSITATAPNFKTTELKGVNLDVSQTLAENLTLAVGGNEEVIDVQAASITTDTETSSNGQTLQQEQVAELPLANRQFYNLVQVAPGVTPPAQNSSMGFRGGMNVNGSPETANMFLVNGTFDLDISTNQPTFRPSVDTIAEFKVITGVPSADYGRVQGGQIVIVTKQGSNKFHGSLYEFIRNGAIEARPWSPSAALAGSKSPAFKQNTFGGTVGGPVLKDKAFFFFGYEGQRIRQQITAAAQVPAPWQQAGCLPGNTNLTTTAGVTTVAAYDPATGNPLPFTNTGACTNPFGAYGFDATAATTWNSQSAALGKLLTSLVYPATNIPFTAGGVTKSVNVNSGTPIGSNLVAPGTYTLLTTPGNDYNFNETRSETMDEYNTRFDYKLSDKNSFDGTFNHFHDPSFEPNNSLCSSRILPNFGCYTDQITWLFNVGETHIFTPNLLNEVRFGWNRLQQPRVQQDNFTYVGAQWAAVGGLPGAFNGTIPNNLGVPSVSEASSYTATGGQTNLPQNRWDNHFDIDDAVTWTHKGHTFKAGVQALMVKTTEFEGLSARGSVTFNPTNLKNSQVAPCKTCGTTGDTIGDTLLGYVSADTDTPTAPTVYNRYNSFDFFLMDDWKIKSNLTLNLGVRYELDLPESEKFGAISTFSPSTPDPLYTGAAGSFANPNGGFVTAAQNGKTTLSSTDRNNFAPRIGFAWQPLHNDKTVVKGGYGVFFAEPQAFNEYLNFSTQYPVRYTKNFTPTAFSNGGAITLAAPFPAELPAAGTPYCPTAGTNGCNAPVIGQPCQSPCSLIPVISGTQVDPHYATPYVSQWTLGVQRQLTKTTLAEVLYFANKGSKIAFGCTAGINYNTSLNSGNNFATNAPTATQPLTTYSAISSQTLQSERVYPQWSTLGFHTTGCNSEYQSLQGRMQETTKSGISILVTYTYARGEDNLVPAQNPSTRAFDKQLSNFDIRHRLVISPVIPLPFGKGRMFANSGIASALLGGFKVSGIYQYFTGRPFGIIDSTPQSGAGSSPTTTVYERPDLIIGQHLTGSDPVNNTSTHNSKEWFNIHSLSYNPPGTYGTLAPDTIEGPGWDELDITLGRTFAIKEYAKAEFKVDAFNLLNHPNLYNPLSTTYSGSTTFTSTGYPTAPGYCASTFATGTPSLTPQTGCTSPGSFGSITQANAMREIQASVHITF